MKIYKYELTAHKVLLELPRGARILSVQVQHGVPVLWAAVEPTRMLREPRVIRIVATGEEFDADGASYISTFQLEGGNLIFHAYEVGV